MNFCLTECASVNYFYPRKCSVLLLEYIYIYIYIYNSWNLDCAPWVSWIFLQNNNHQAVGSTQPTKWFSDNHHCYNMYIYTMYVYVWCVCVCVCVYFGSISSLIQMSLNIIDIFCLHIFFWIRSYCRIAFIVFGRNWFMYCP